MAFLHASRSLGFSLYALAFAVGSCWHASARCANQPAPAAPSTLRVAAVQMRSTRSLSENVEVHRKHLERCAREGAQVVVFPECSLTGYSDDESMHKLKAEDVRAALDSVARACK